MNGEQLAFVNQQLAAMLRSGLPLEGALQQLAATMAHGELRTELELLQADLATGTPLAVALDRRKLPVFYKQMVRVGVASNDLPGVLTLLADYYQHTHVVGMRLKGLMVYPAIVLACSVALSGFFTWLMMGVMRTTWGELFWTQEVPAQIYVQTWGPFVLLAAVALVVMVATGVPAWRKRWQWWCAPFREAGLANFAAAMALLLRGGCPLGDALALVEQLEQGTPLGEIVRQWRAQLAAGTPAHATSQRARHHLPGLFVWLVNGAGEDMAGGFARAAELYRSRALYQTELMLYAALPVATLFLGLLILGQLAAMLRAPLEVLVNLSMFS